MNTRLTPQSHTPSCADTTGLPLLHNTVTFTHKILYIYSLRRNSMAIFKRISLLCLTVFMALALGCAATSTREGTGEYVDDSAITAKVKAVFLGESTLNSGEINVETFKGVVQLSGFVSSVEQTNTAVVLARRVKGVSDVRNDMRIKGQQ